MRMVDEDAARAAVEFVLPAIAKRRAVAVVRADLFLTG
jgi:hypothetical protein